ncbi:DUF4214 domain-containing protein [Sphingobium yanoikuyae]|uniref:DUF4214 domain-containing protein n=1 Tax=Sphingobium yanoikuyae TaxID=13690 RepID=UPI0035B3F778
MDIFDFDRRNPNLRAATLDELCSFSGLQFIRCAFITILGREVDETGQAYYNARLRAGMSKLTIISDLRQSPEGQRFDPGIAGLDRALRKHRNANRKFVGPIIRWLTGREGNGILERRLRAICYELEIERNLAGARAATANHLVIMLDGKVEQVRRELRSALASQSITPRHVALSEAAGDIEWEQALSSVLNG